MRIIINNVYTQIVYLRYAGDFMLRLKNGKSHENGSHNIQQIALGIFNRNENMF